jgi:hypothetical protein
MIDPWEKAAECERAIRISFDPHRKSILTNLRELWMTLANEKSMGMPDWQVHAERIVGLHADFVKLQ